MGYLCIAWLLVFLAGYYFMWQAYWDARKDRD